MLAVGSSLQNLGNATSSSSETSGGSSGGEAAAPIPTLTPATASVLISAAALAFAPVRRSDEEAGSGDLGSEEGSGEAGAPSAPAPLGVVNSVTEAADFLGTIFKASASVDRTSAVVATATISSLIGEAATVADTATVDENEGVASAAKALQGAVEGLGTAALAGMEGDSKPLVLKSPDLNMTVEARPAAALSEQPISCDTAGEEVRVELPASVLAGAGADASEDVGVLLYASAFNFHGMGDLGASGGGAEARATHLLLASAAEVGAVGAWPRAARPPGVARGRAGGRALRRCAASPPPSRWRHWRVVTVRRGASPGAAVAVAAGAAVAAAHPTTSAAPVAAAPVATTEPASAVAAADAASTFAGAVAAAVAAAAVAAVAVAAATLAAAHGPAHAAAAAGRRSCAAAAAVRRGAAVPVLGRR